MFRQIILDSNVCTGPSSSTVYTFSGTTSPDSMLFTQCSKLTVEFYSNAAVQGPGYCLYYQLYSNTGGCTSNLMKVIISYMFIFEIDSVMFIYFFSFLHNNIIRFTSNFNDISAMLYFLVCGVYIDSQGTFTSPNYPSNYPNNADCSYYVTLTQLSTIFFYFNSTFAVEKGYDSVTVWN